MIADLKPYAEYKESGLAWLGQVPGHWRPTKLKHAFSRIIGGSTPASGNANYWNGDVTWVTPADVSRSERLRRSIRQISRAGMVSCSTQLVPKDSIILTTRAPVGNVSIADVELCTNQGCKALIPDSNVIAPMFGFWLLSVMKDEIQSLSTGTTFSEVSTTRLGSTVGILPPPAEQAAIVRFLDWANGRLERAIRAKRKVIALLGEQKQAIIHRAVTRGLDPSVPLKPSGIPWLGDIPQHWEVRRLGRLANVFNGSTPSRAQPAYWSNATIPWLASGKVNDGLVSTPSELITARALAECGLTIVPSGALLMGLIGQGRTRGMCALLTIDACISQNLAAVVPGSALFNQFLYYVLVACYRDVREFGRGGNQAALNCEIVGRLPIPVPPMDEQRAMSQALKHQVSHLLPLEGTIEREIELLREYRTRLVADVVTGKLDVREAALHLPDEAPPETVEDDADLNTDADASDEETTP